MSTIYGTQTEVTYDVNGDPILTGTGDDTITGSSGDDTIYALEGNNVVDGGDGNDIIYGGNIIYYDDHGVTRTDQGTDLLLGGNGNDTIYSGTQQSTIYGGAGNDTIVGGAGSIVDGGSGNDAISSSGNITVLVGTQFGYDRLSSSGSSNTVEFDFNRPADIKLHRNHEDLYIETHEGILRIQDYFRNMDPNSTDPDYAPRFTLQFQDGELTASEVQSSIMQGGGNDDTVGTQLDEFQTNPIIVTGGAGHDWVEILNVPEEPYQSGRIGIVDGGSGDDVYNVYTQQTTVAFSRNSGRDLMMDVDQENRRQYQEVTIAVSDSDGAVTASDLSLQYENGVFALRIAGSDAALVILPTTIARILTESISWTVDVGGNTVDVKSLIENLTSDGSLVINTSSSYDGSSNSNNETVISGGADITVGSDDERILGAGNTVLLQEGFGHDTILNGNTIHIEQDASEFTFSRNGASLSIVDSNGNQLDVLTVFVGNGVRRSTDELNVIFGYGGSTPQSFTWGDLSQALALSSDSNTIHLEAEENLAAGPGVEATNQVFYADIGYTTVNAGSGNNTIHVSTGTSIIHDTALGGHDVIPGGLYSGDFAALTIKADDIDDLDFSYDGNDTALTVTNTVTGSTIVFTASGRDNIFFDDGSGPVSITSQLPTLVMEDNAGLILPTSYTQTSLESSSSNTSDILDGRSNPAFGKWRTLDGKGGSDTYYGGAQSDIFVYSAGGADVIKGIENNDYATVGYDIVDFRSAGIAKSSLSTLFSRDGDDLVFDDSNGSLRIEGFFLDKSQESLLEKVFAAQLNGENPLPTGPDLVPTTVTVVRGLASLDGPFSATNVIDSLHFTDGIATKADILALFPDHAVPTPGDDVLYADELGNTIDALAGNDIVHGNASNDTLIGNDGDDVLYGYDGDDTLDGGDGNNTLVGGNGNDTYIVTSTGDTVTENVDEGYDVVQSFVSFTLEANIEDLSLQGSDNIDGTGNDLSNFITGNDGSNTIDGREGDDIMIGGLGDDSYYIDSLGDLVIENEGEGNDTIYIASSISSDYTIPEGIENVFVLGSDNFDVYGNSANNGILGNSGNNLLSGDDGNDTLLGGGGNDTLIGGAGTDSLRGGTGNDLYIISASGDNADVITEYSGEGTDTVESAITFTLGSNLENLTLTYSANINGTGNSLNNVLTGNGGNNTLTGGGGNDTLDGGAGTDILIGGTGDDTYILAASGDTITENNNEGTDTVVAGYSYTLGSNLENLTLSGSGNFTATGNALNNVLTGNSGTNTLTGNAGNDTLKGGAGNDQLLGGVGNDTYVLNRGDGSDAITENDSTAGNTDVARFGESGTAINHDQLWFKMNGSNLEISVIGTSDKFVINSWSSGSARQVESFVASDGYHMTNAQVAGLVSAMSSFSPPASGTTTLDPGSYSTVLSQIAVAWSA